MCGICGFFQSADSGAREEARRVVEAMTDTLAHRGPDDQGIWLDPGAGVALGHRRLSIIDLSREGHQPMSSAAGRFTIVFNGEIYNFRELRRDLEAEGATFRGHSDTEVLLEACERWGIEPALRKCVGMFAFAMWDHAERRLILARDRTGEKPLYYGRLGDSFVFASELKALHRYPSFDPEIDRGALTLLLRDGYIPTPYSIFKHIAKLAPGHWMEVREGGRRSESHSYWNAREAALGAQERTFRGSEQEAADELEHLLVQSLRGQMIADVPLGAFLSGGIDSSTIVALMQSLSPQPVKTFSIGFKEERFNEAKYANRVAQHLGTDHTELYVTPEEALDVVPLLPALYDEPLADSSQIPTYLVSKLARRHVTVSLSGDGGDELFCGYPHYLYAAEVFRLRQRLPRWFKKGMAPLLKQAGQGADRWRVRTGGTRAVGWLSDLPVHRVRVLGELLEIEREELAHLHIVSPRRNVADLVQGGHEPPSIFTDPARQPGLTQPVQGMMFRDFSSYLPDDILVKVDRASMGVSLEARVPLLDHRVIEFAWSLPLEYKLGGGNGKHILREVLHRHVPRELTERPKMGFVVPVGEWIRGPLRDWAEDLLDPAHLRSEGYFAPHGVGQTWQAHLRGERKLDGILWGILMFQAWRRQWLPA